MKNKFSLLDIYKINTITSPFAIVAVPLHRPSQSRLCIQDNEYCSGKWMG